MSVKRLLSGSSCLLALVLLAGCAEIASQVTGELLGACLEVTAQAVCASVCDDDDDDQDDPSRDEAEAASAKLAESPPPEWRPTVADCEIKQGERGVLVDCAGGTRAVFLAGTEPSTTDAQPFDQRSPTARGPIEVRAPADVGRLAGTRAIEGSLIIASGSLVSLYAPELQTIGGDLLVTHASALESIALPALAHVAGIVVISDNPRLPQHEAEQIVFGLTRHGFAGTVDVGGNEPPAP